MSWSTTGDVDEFLATAGDFLAAHPAENTMPLTIAHTLRGEAHFFGDDDPLFGWWRGPDGTVAAAFLRTPPWPLLLTDGPDGAVRSLAGTLLGIGHAVPGVNAPVPVAEAFADGWRERTGSAIRGGRRTRLYRLDTLTPPDPPPAGAARVAGTGDRDLVLTWFHAFVEELDEPGDHSADVDHRLDYGGLTLWEVDGVPVSMAGITRPVAGVARVAPVYTPKPLRGKGYGGAVTAAVSRAALDAGSRVVLFTDLANPTSNALYQRLGYRPVQDRVILAFG